MPAFDEAGIGVYALSYDEPEALRDFQDAHNITYTLLSDPDSAVIRSFGILNTLIAEDDHPWFGIPYPGTYIINESGVITAKFFDNNLAVRVGSEQLLRSAKGEELDLSTLDSSETKEVAVAISVEGGSLTPTVLKDLVASFNVPAGKHVYAEPAPAGSITVDLKLDVPAGLVTRPVIRPISEPHKLAGTDEVFEVHHGEFELRIPLTVNNAAGEEMKLVGEVVWQSCDDDICDIPAKQSFEITVPVTASPSTALGSKKGAALEPNAMAHFQKMSERRKPK